jgi:hypothetical protein
MLSYGIVPAAAEAVIFYGAVVLGKLIMIQKLTGSAIASFH